MMAGGEGGDRIIVGGDCYGGKGNACGGGDGVCVVVSGGGEKVVGNGVEVIVGEGVDENGVKEQSLAVEGVIESVVVGDFLDNDVKLVDKICTDVTAEVKEEEEDNVGLSESGVSAVNSLKAGEFSEESVKPAEEKSLDLIVDLGEDKNAQKEESDVGLGKSLTLKDQNNVESKKELSESGVSVVNSLKAGEFSEESVKPADEKSLDLIVDLGEDRHAKKEESDVGLGKSSTLKDQNNVESKTELSESGVSVVNSLKAGEFSEESVKTSEQKSLVLIVDLGEDKNLQNVVLGEGGCEREDVETKIGEEKSKVQWEPISVKEKEEILESATKIYGSVDCDSHQVYYEEELKRMADSGTDEDVAPELATETDAPVEKGFACEPDLVKSEVSCYEETDESIKGSQGSIQLIATPAIASILPCPAVSVISENKIVEVPVECGQSIITDSGDSCVVEQDLVITGNSLSVVIQGNEGEDVENETSKAQDGNCRADLEGIVAAQTKEQCECIDGSQKMAGSHKHADTLHSPTSYLSSSNENGVVPDKNCRSFVASLDAGSVSDQRLAVADSNGSGIVGEHGHVVLQGTNELLESETITVPTSDQNNISQDDDVGESRGSCPKSAELNRSPEIDENVISRCVIIEEKVGKLPTENGASLQSSSGGNTIVEREIENVAAQTTTDAPTFVTNGPKINVKVENHNPENVETAPLCVADGTKPEIKPDNGLEGVGYGGTNIEFGSINPAQIFSVSNNGDDMRPKCIYDEAIPKHLDTEKHASDSVPVVRCEDMKSESDIQNSSAIGYSDMPGKDTSLPESEGSSCNTVDGDNLGAQNVTKPFYFLIRLPRFDDEGLREQIRNARQLVQEKSRRREAIGAAIRSKKPRMQALDDKFEASKSEKKDLMKSIELKRQEIDSLHVVINRVKNAISVQDINNRIYHLEQVIGHETLPLKDEKLIIREIKQMTQLRDELSANIGSQEEVAHALDEKNDLEGRLRVLKKELDSLKEKDSKVSKVLYWSGRKYDEEMEKLREMHAQYKATDAIYQEAVKHLGGLKSQLYEKINNFARYKDDVKSASDYALNGDKEALHRHCLNQVETIMQKWNKNEDFRKDYVRCNMRSTVRRLKTLDGRFLGPGEESPVLPKYVTKTVDKHHSQPLKAASQAPVPPPLEQEKSVSVVKGEVAECKIMEAAEPENQKLKSKTSTKVIPESGLETDPNKVEDDVETKADEIVQTEEELELARKEEMLRKQEMEAKLKEQRRLEEKAKALEALERKKRIAEKAQLRAELRAQKEAELKEKEREKRLRKKEKRNTDGGETTPVSESESKDSPTTVTKPKKAVRYTKQVKTVAALPPALRNRGRKRLKQFMWWTLGALFVLFVFLIGNGGAFGNLRSRKDDTIFGNRRI